MEKIEQLAGRYWQMAFSYLETAKLIHENDPNPNMLFPFLYNIGHSFGLFLRGHLVVADGPEADPESYGHYLDDLWGLEPITPIRKRAEGLLSKYRGKDASITHLMAAPTQADEASFEDYLSLLSEVFGSDLNYVLQDPPKFVTGPEELLAVLPSLYREIPPLEIWRR